MRLVLVADAFPPMRSSAAIQLLDLANEIKTLNHEIWVMIPSCSLSTQSELETLSGINVLRLRCPLIKDANYLKRALNEIFMPFLMIKNIRKSQAKDILWDGIIWYSPTIFLGFVAFYLKYKSRCKAYLILRDIFPKWALNLGLINKGPTFYFLTLIEYFQYWVADVIGIQSEADLEKMNKWVKKNKRKLELLKNWLADRSNTGCSICINRTILAGRIVLVYAGNMGIAQDVSQLVELAFKLRDKSDIGFLFIGRGKNFTQLRKNTIDLNLENILFYDEISPEEIPGLYSQCHIGLISLDSRHQTSNIPGKFISYTQAGLPVLAVVNEGNDLINLIKDHRMGVALTSTNAKSSDEIYADLIKIVLTTEISENCRSFYLQNYLTKIAAKQIISSLRDNLP